MSYAVGDLVSYIYKDISGAVGKVGIILEVTPRASGWPPLLAIRWTSGHTASYDADRVEKVVKG